LEKLTHALIFVINSLLKFVVANALVLLIIMLLPVLLITDNISVVNQIMDYLFSGKS